MSVANYSNSELTALAYALGGLETEGLTQCLTALAMANRSAEAMTYGEWDTTPIDLTVPIDMRHLAQWDSVTQWARNLLYNCVSNAGTSFAPDNYREQLLTLAAAADARVAASKASNVVQFTTRSAPVAVAVLEPQHMTTNGWVADRAVPAATVTPARDEYIGRAEAVRQIREALKRRSGKVWSVRGDTGTAWGWITITAPPKVNPKGWMNEAQIAELTTLLGLTDRPAHPQGVSVPASTDYYREYIDRANGIEPTVYGKAYWD